MKQNPCTHPADDQSGRRASDTPSGTRRHMAAALLALGGLLAIACGPVAAQTSYPQRPIRVVVPFPPGESIDVVTRIISDRWSALLGQPLVIDNRGGAGGMIGTDMVAKAPPDGYTILVGNVGGLSIIPAIDKKTPYDVMKDLAPVSQISNVPFFMYVSAQTPFTAVQSVIDYAKKNPGKLNYASTGIGSGVHLAGELFKNVAGVDMVHVPYKGVSLAMPELISGNVQLVFYPITFSPQVKDGKLRALIVTANKRWPGLPDTPTSAEVGLPGMIASSWHAVMAPAGTPPEIINKLQSTLATVLADPAIRERLLGVGAEPVGSTPAELRTFMQRELNTWRNTAAKSGITLQ